MVGNILNFNTIYQNILNAQKAGNIGSVYFYMGRLTYIMIYFQPIVYSSL